VGQYIKTQTEITEAEQLRKRIALSKNTERGIIAFQNCDFIYKIFMST
jgi:hypothetical protein